jgi:hypothetical protein
MRLAMQADARRTTAAGLTFRETATERQLARQLRAIRRDPWRTLNDGATASADALANGYQAVASGQVRQTLRQHGARVVATLGDRWAQLTALPSDLMPDIGSRMPPTPGRPAAALVHGGAAALAVAHDRLAPDRRSAAYRLGADRQIHVETSPTVPADVQTLPQAQANLPRLLREGYTVRQQHDGTVQVWRAAGPTSAAGAHPPATPNPGGTP